MASTYKILFMGLAFCLNFFLPDAPGRNCVPKWKEFIGNTVSVTTAAICHYPGNYFRIAAIFF